MAEYDRIPIEKKSGIKEKLKELFPNLNYTETLTKLLENFDKEGTKLDKKAIWIDESTYNKLNEKGKVSDNFDDVINDLLDKGLKRM